MIKLAILALVTTITTSTAIAVPQASPMIGGINVYCQLPNGMTVYTDLAVMNDVARAGTQPYPMPPGFIPMIYLNPQAMPLLPPPVQLFIYGHECMHHRLGHTLGNINLSMEVDADCTAVQLLKSQGLLDANTTQLVASFFQNNPPMPPFYPSGPERAQRILMCFNEG
ncbi:hypothetical protein CSV86_020985 [Pseudomonas putida CSV86]|uniref:Uncharacterized protein n=1 Tax=Pseudomonas bharatica CSV86 TaxID=1005395 RepID=A0A7K4EII9_9PSED|nr:MULTISPECIES: hypothetical protein [Pseudomonas]MDG9881900.1 hypothetical protein [Pseudomonas sp. GD04058]NNJ17482.1 hypothetical protein [Pseudomonas bharatica CSV86]